MPCERIVYVPASLKDVALLVVWQVFVLCVLSRALADSSAGGGRAVRLARCCCSERACERKVCFPFLFADTCALIECMLFQALCHSKQGEIM